MFDSGHKYHRINITKVSEKLFLRQHLYNFRASKRRYIAVVEEYEFQVFIVKFFPLAISFQIKNIMSSLMIMMLLV